MPFQALPWMPNADQFLHAIIAGSQLAESRAERRSRNSGGGGGYGSGRPVVESQAPAVTPTDPHLVLNGSILSMVDPATEADKKAEAGVRLSTSGGEDPLGISGSSRLSGTADAVNNYLHNSPTPQPFTAAGQQFITNPITGQPQPYVEPSVIEKVGDNLVKVNPKSFTATPIFQGGNSDGVRLSEVDSSGMDPTALQMAQMFNPPRLSGSPNAVSNYLHHATANPAGLPPKPDDRVKVKSPDGRTGNIPRSQLKEALANGYVEIK